jgi:polyphenol oxidase
MLSTMVFHNESSFTIFFGDIQNKFDPKQFYDCSSTSYTHGSNKGLLQREPFYTVNTLLRCSNLLFLHQVHGSQGIAIRSEEQAVNLVPFSYDADFISTNIPGVGLCVATADCLPIILYDTLNHAICNIHIGWRGALNNIIKKAVEHMKETYQTQPHHLRAFFGPCAKSCCYAVGTELLEQLSSFSCALDVTSINGKTVFFDLPKFCIFQLEDLGLEKKAIVSTYVKCTMCDASFCSHRRSKGASERNMTIVTLVNKKFY